MNETGKLTRDQLIDGIRAKLNERIAAEEAARVERERLGRLPEWRRRSMERAGGERWIAAKEIGR